jgi:GNAT superfamily N-acetyltransferase
MESIRVERAGSGDIPALTELLATLFALESDFSADHAKQCRGLELLLAQPADRAALFVARRSDNGAVAGMASGQLVISTAEGAPSAWIEDVIVREPLRGRGIAKLLLGALLDWAEQHGATRAQLLSDGTNSPALDFYRHIGWQPTRLSAWRRSLHKR